MPFLAGTMLALVFVLFAHLIGLDRNRAFYPKTVIVIALCYDLFAIMAGSSHALLWESVAFGAFVLVAAIGFKTNLWLVAGALLLHGLFDAVHDGMIANPGVPAWWPVFCLTFDVVAAGFLALLLTTGRIPASASRSTGTSFGDRIRPYVDRELLAAERCAVAGDVAASFSHLERAHVLGQASTREHVRAHWHMLLWAIRQRNAHEMAGQLFRIFGAATKTAIGLVPTGNTGGTNISPVQRLPIPAELAILIESAHRLPQRF